MNQIMNPQNSTDLIQPTQSLEVVETSRMRAIIESQLTVAQSRPRNEVAALDRIRNSCQRQRLAENAVYEYKKGGQDISGPSIDLIKVVAMHWGNIDFGYKELARGAGESTVEAYAWDMETNAKYSRQFVVPHFMETRNGIRKIKPGEMQDWIANQAQRRVRTAIENVIPNDIIDDAVDECAKTLQTKIQVNDQTVGKMVKAFAGLGVTVEQIQDRIQRPPTEITPAQFAKMQRIYKSIKDGISQISDWFHDLEAPAKEDKSKVTEAIKEAQAPKQETATEPEVVDTPEEAKKETQAEMCKRWERTLRTMPTHAMTIESLAIIDGDDLLSETSKKKLAKIGRECLEQFKSVGNQEQREAATAAESDQEEGLFE